MRWVILGENFGKSTELWPFISTNWINCNARIQGITYIFKCTFTSNWPIKKNWHRHWIYILAFKGSPMVPLSEPSNPSTAKLVLVIVQKVMSDLAAPTAQSDMFYILTTYSHHIWLLRVTKFHRHKHPKGWICSLSLDKLYSISSITEVEPTHTVSHI